MAAFLYRAVDPAGRAKKGVIEAANATGARQALREQDLLPLSVEATSSRKTDIDAKPSLLDALRPALSARALSLLTRQLATLIGSGTSIEESLRTVAQQTTAPRAASVMLNVRAAILDGRSFAEALGEYPAAFPEFYRASIAAGEQSGHLGDVMEHLAAFVEARQKNRQTVQLALLYPALLAVVSLGIITLLLVYVVPDIVRVFTARGADLPALTRGLIAVSGFINIYGWMLVLGVVAIFVAFRQWVKIPKNRLAWHRLLLNGPMTRSFARQSNAAQFSGTLATLVQSGVPLMDALNTAAQVTPNHFVRAKVAELAARVREGATLRNSVMEANVFPPMLIAMIASGETSGKLGDALARAAADQQRELDAWVATLLALVEPGILILMGGLVLILVMAILLPIVGLNNLAGL